MSVKPDAPQISADTWLTAQHAVLGSVLLDHDLIPKLIHETSRSDFAGPCRTVYIAIEKLFRSGNPIDLVSIAHELGDAYRKFLMELMSITPTTAHFDYHLQLCREQARVQEIHDIAGKLLSADSVDDIRPLLEQAASLMIDKSRNNVKDAGELLRDFMERMQSTVNYLPWPIAVCSDNIQSEPGDFIIIGAEPSVGKTAFALQCGWFWAKTMKVGFFSFETRSQKLFDRKMASEAGLDMEKIKHRRIGDADWDHIWQAQPGITECSIRLIEAAGYSTADIRAEIMRYGFDIIIIDYLQLVTSRGHNRYEEVTKISLDLHLMAQRMGVTIVGLSQLSRTDEDRRPRNSDLRESGQLEQDADVIMMLWHEKKSNPRGNRNLTVTKNKEGEWFETLLAFDGKHQLFSKALRTGETVAKYVADGKKARRQNREPEQMAFAELPNDTQVPFERS